MVFSFIFACFCGAPRKVERQSDVVPEKSPYRAERISKKLSKAPSFAWSTVSRSLSRKLRISDVKPNVESETTDERSAQNKKCVEPKETTTITEPNTSDTEHGLSLTSPHVRVSDEYGPVINQGETESETIQRLLLAATNPPARGPTVQSDIPDVELEEVEEIPLEPHEMPKAYSRFDEADLQTKIKAENDRTKEKTEERILILEARLQVQYDEVSRLRAELTEMRDENMELQIIIEDSCGSRCE